MTSLSAQHNVFVIQSPQNDLVVSLNEIPQMPGISAVENVLQGDYYFKFSIPTLGLVDSLTVSVGESDSVVIDFDLEKSKTSTRFYKRTCDKNYRVEVERTVYFVVEEMPRFSDSDDALNMLIQDEVEKAVDFYGLNTKGKVLVHFVVAENGAVKNVRILKGVNEQLDSIAQNIVKNIPLWESPGKLRGQPVRVALVLQVKF
jgi:hypothetical protein